jgi:hypothetical protein
MRSITGFCALTAAAAGLLLIPVAGAQAQSPSTPPATSPSAAPTTIPEGKLDAAAAAVKRVSAVRDSFEQQVAKAPPADKERLAGEANDAMKKAVTDQGLSVEEYTTILKVAQNDPSVREKLLQRLK